MTARSPRWAAFLLACLVARLAAAGPAAAQDAPSAPASGRRAAILAPARLRQGDPLLAWILLRPEAAPPAGLSAQLVNAAGKIVASGRCFSAAAMLADAAPAAAAAAEAGPAEAVAGEAVAAPRLLGALFAIPPDFAPGRYRLLAGGAEAGLVVEARSFPLETIKLDAANTKLRTEPTTRKDEEARRLYALIGRVDDSAVLAGAGPFLFPAEGGWKSAGFGDVRRYLYPDGGSDRSVHAGLDWAVVAGTAVRACARGRVVLAADREVTGTSVVIEHLPGLYSIYFHLSSIEVEEGALVERGDPIALSGSTGMSTGPHLHWELRAKGAAVDPEYWLALPLLDKDAVTAIMSGLIEGR